MYRKQKSTIGDLQKRKRCDSEIATRNKRHKREARASRALIGTDLD